MPRAKRTPIDYPPQFGGIMFRPREVVEDEIACWPTTRGRRGDAEEEPNAGTPPGTRRCRDEQDRTSERTNERTNGRTVDAVRHSFDIWQDQLIALDGDPDAALHRDGPEAEVGRLVQEALDAYIAKHRSANERTVERTNDHEL